MSSCVLCLELKEELVDSIVINSKEWHESNISNILNKHLWPMKHIDATSWICMTCWKELYSFHKFYVRIEESHKDLGLFAKASSDTKESNFNNPTGINEILENCLEKNEVGELEANPVEEFKDLLNMYDLSDNRLHCDIINEQENPLLQYDLHKETLIDSSPLVQRRKRGRPRKNTSNGNKNTKSATKKCKPRIMKTICNAINRSLSKIKEKKVGAMITKSNHSVKRNGTAILNLLEIKPELKPVREESKLSFDKCSDSNESDREPLDHFETKSSINIKCPLKINHNEKDKFLTENFKISCYLCNIPFETFFNMLKHFEVKHQTERGHAKCCNKKFYRRSVLVDHVHYHLNPNYFKCGQCKKVMADRRCLELHIESHENNQEKNHCCDICGKGFAKLGVLKKHRMIHLSEEEKRFTCSDCGKNFASNYMLSSHYRTVHLKKYTKICDICGKSIRCKDVFERHMLQHEGKTAPSVNCDICGLILTDKKALKRHKDIIHPIGGQHEYTCSICSKTSPNLRAHKRHVQYKHVMGYDHKCTICEKAFKRAPTLKEHMASHTGTVLYTCPWCPKTFNSNANMHNHRKKVHPKEWEEASRKRYSGNLPPNYKPPTITDSADFTMPLDI